MPDPKPVKIFISSPGDVSEERFVAERVIKRLVPEFLARGVRLEPMFWEYEPVALSGDYCSQIPRPSGFDLFLCILWSRLGTPLHSSWLEIEGRRFQSGTEFEIVDALDSYEKKKTPLIDVWINKTEPVFPARPQKVRDSRIRQYDMLQDFLANWTKDQEENTFIRAVNGYSRLDRFEELLETKLRTRLERYCKLVKQHRADPSWTGPPYRGLATFHAEHAEIFCGRTRAVGDVVKLFKSRLVGNEPTSVLVEGPSGSGKSSLALAGLVPFLSSDGVVEGFSSWRAGYFRPSQDASLLRGLATALCIGEIPADGEESRLGGREPLPELLQGDRDLDEFAELLKDNAQQAIGRVEGVLGQIEAVANRDRLYELEKVQAKRSEQGRTADVEAIGEVMENLPQLKTGLILVVDQLEELLTEAGGSGETEKFLEVLGALAATRRVFVLGTVRSDFQRLLRTEISVWLETFPQSSTYALDPLDNSELGQVIAQPARAAGLGFERDRSKDESLEITIRDAAIAHREALPLIQFALQRLYEKRDEENTLTHKAFREIEGVEGAVASYAEEVVDGLDEKTAAEFDNVFRKLITVRLDNAPGETGNLSAMAARVAARKEVVGGDETSEIPARAAFADALTEARLLRQDRDGAGNRRVRIAHDALITHWSTLREKAQEWRGFLADRAAVQQNYAQWKAEGEDKSYLLASGRQLKKGTALLRDHRGHLDGELIEYVDASRSRSRGRNIVLAVCSILVTGGILWTGYDHFSEMNNERIVADLEEQFEIATAADYPDHSSVREIALRLMETSPRSTEHVHRDYAEALIELKRNEELDDFLSREYPGRHPAFLELKRARALANSEKLDEAVSLYREVLGRDDLDEQDVADGLRGLAKVYHTEKEWLDLGRVAARLTEVEPTAEAFVWRAEAALMERRWDDAGKFVESALVRDPDAKRANDLEANLVSLAQWEEQLADLDASIVQDSGNFEARANRGWVLLLARFPELAAVDFSVAAQTVPSAVSAQLGAAICEKGLDAGSWAVTGERDDKIHLVPIYQEDAVAWIDSRLEHIGNLIKIESSLERERTTGDTIEILDLLMHLDQHPIIVERCGKLDATTLSPQDRGFVFFLHGLALARMGRINEVPELISPCVSELQLLLVLSHTDGVGSLLTDLYWLRGWGYINLEDPQSAIADFGRCLFLAPAHMGSLEGRAKAYELLGNTEAAEADRAELERLRNESQ